MSSTMLQLVNQVQSELNLAITPNVAGNPSQDTQQILALMNRAGYDLVKEHNWQALELEYRFYTTAITTTCDTIANTYNLLNVANTTV
jgi:lauroyl/myristoyl acyltransferase